MLEIHFTLNKKHISPGAYCGSKMKISLEEQAYEK
jgi:hypothetical protein